MTDFTRYFQEASHEFEVKIGRKPRLILVPEFRRYELFKYFEDNISLKNCESLDNTLFGIGFKFTQLHDYIGLQ